MRLHVRNADLWCSARLAGASPVLVAPPFGPLDTPSLGLSMLKALGFANGFNVAVRYSTVAFAKLIGPDVYQAVSQGRPTTTALVGEWLFSPPDDRADNEYLEQHLLASARFHRSRPNPARLSALKSQLLCVRRQVPAFVDAEVGRILSLKPSFVGFTSVFQQTRAALWMARLIKEVVPGIPVVLGGANCEAEMGEELFARFEDLDAVVSGEGECAFLRLLNWADEEPKVGHERYDSVLLDSVPAPDFSDYFEQLNDIEGVRPRLLYEASRGCWWGQRVHCTFCGLNGESMRFREKSPKKVIEDLREISGANPGLPIHFADNILSFRYFKTLLPVLSTKPLDVPLFCETKANLTWSQLQLMRQAGFGAIQPGIESLSDEALQRMGKGVRAIQNLFLLRSCRELGISVAWNWLWGFPGEDEAELGRMAALVPWFEHLEAPASGAAIRIDRFSPLFNQPVEHGLRSIEPCEAYRFAFPEVPATSLAKLAYFFECHYADGRNPLDYSHSLEEAIARWQANQMIAELIVVSDAERSIVWDTRSCAVGLMHTLTGLEHEVFVECQGITAVTDLMVKFDERQSDVSSAVESLIQRKLCIRIGASLLTLPLRLEFYEPPPQKLGALASKLRAQGVAFPFEVLWKNGEVLVEGSPIDTPSGV
jgi:ribosomal peptide maturation radical SAM protein 1